jgi:hypothetical protein
MDGLDKDDLVVQAQLVVNVHADQLVTHVSPP